MHSTLYHSCSLEWSFDKLAKLSSTQIIVSVLALKWQTTRHFNQLSMWAEETAFRFALTNRNPKKKNKIEMLHHSINKGSFYWSIV